jgi:hypothetical protein
LTQQSHTHTRTKLPPNIIYCCHGSRQILCIWSLWLLFALTFTASVTGAQTTSAPHIIEAEIDNTAPYIGQPITYTWRLLTSDIQRFSLRNFRIPDFDGFYVRDIFTPDNPNTELRNGTIYTEILERRTLIPLRSGQLTVEALRIVAPETPFDDAIALDGPTFTLNVQPLPANAPDSFTNAVGQFDIEATISQDDIAVGDATDLRLIVRGSGNLEQALAPELDLPDSWRVYRQSPQFTTESATFGSKTFRWTLVPGETGTLTLSELNFSFFEPQSGQYITRTANPLSIEVRASDDPFQGFNRNPDPNDMDTAASAQNPPLKPLAVKPPQQSLLPDETFWLLWLISPGLLVLAWFVRPKHSAQATTMTNKQPKRQQRSKALQQALADIRAAQGLDAKAAHERIPKVIQTYLSQKSGQAINRDSFAKVLERLPDDKQTKLRALLSQANAGRYAPVSADDQKALLKDAYTLLSRIDADWK